MHLNISPSQEFMEPICMQRWAWNYFLSHREFYKFITSLNDADNNVLAEVGLSQITPSYSNIHGGLDFSEVTV